MYNCALYYRTALRIILGIYDPLIYQNVIRPPLIYQEGFTTHAYTTKTEKIRGH